VIKGYNVCHIDVWGKWGIMYINKQLYAYIEKIVSKIKNAIYNFLSEGRMIMEEDKFRKSLEEGYKKYLSVHPRSSEKILWRKTSMAFT